MLTPFSNQGSSNVLRLVFTTINLRSIVGCISLLSFLIRHHFPTQNLLSDAKVREDVVERFL